MKRKIIFSDIDGTLINSKHLVTPKTRDALRRQIINGNLFVPVSARLPKGIMTAAGQVTTSCPIIAYNGALVLDETGYPLNSQFMSTSIASDVCTYVEKNSNLLWNVYSGYNWLAPINNDPWFKNEEKKMGAQALPSSIKSITKLKGVHKILIAGDPNQLNNLMKELVLKFTELNFVKSAPTLLEVTIKGISKSNGVKILAKEFNIDLKDCWAFGDNYNDLEMLQTVGHPIVMGNAPDDLKEQFTYITSDNDHDGIAEALVTFN